MRKSTRKVAKKWIEINKECGYKMKDDDLVYGIVREIEIIEKRNIENEYKEIELLVKKGQYDIYKNMGRKNKRKQRQDNQ